MIGFTAGLRTIVLSSLASTSAAMGIQPTNESTLLKVELEKSSFIEHEPIQLLLTIGNRGRKPLSAFHRTPVLSFDLENTGLSRVEGQAAVEMGITATARIEPGGSVSVPLFLQQFIRPPRPGKYRVPLVLRTEVYHPDDSNKRTYAFAETKTEILFTVTGRHDQKLRAVCEAYFHKATDPDNSERQWEGLQGLAAIGDPIVVPYLIRLAADMFSAGQALHLLSRFKDVEQARDAVQQALESQTQSVVADALRVLTTWKHELTARQIAQLLDRKSDTINARVAQYARAMGQEKYLKLLPDAYGRARDTSAEVKVTMTSREFMEHEPIGFEVVLANKGPGLLSPDINYPTLVTRAGQENLTLDLRGTSLKRAKPGWVGTVGHTFLEPIQASDRSVRTFYLQRFVSQPPPGNYRVPFKLAAAYLVGYPIFDTEKVAAFEGSFDVIV
jgi:hypothetical protein